MKQPHIFSFILLLMMILAVAPSSMAEDSSNNTTTNTSTLRYQRPTTNRPEKPFRYTIECQYGKGYIELLFPTYIEYLDVTISKDDIPAWSGIVSQDEPSADIPVLYGECTITCITDGGQIFTGYLSF